MQPSCQHSAMTLIDAIPAFTDNYIWMIRDGGDAAVIVDPGDATPVLARLRAEGRRLTAILITHHHRDHTAGIADLVAHFGCPVYGPASESIPGLTHPLQAGDSVDIAEPSLCLRVLAVPGHTAGHIAYIENADGFALVGDTLFAGGCGRLFEGTPAQMLASLEQLAALPPTTLIYCSHEYTLNNLRFAAAVEPDNLAVRQRLQKVQALRSENRITLPSSIGEEITTNPFLRCRLQSVALSAMHQTERTLSDPVEVFAAVRRWKDGF